MNQYKGKCLCGACCYTITGQEPAAMYLCHCSRCRKETGSIHGANLFLNEAQLLWEKGEDKIASFALENSRKQRAFCTICGSPLPRHEGKSQIVVPAGSLDEAPVLEPTAHIFYASRAPWEDKLMDVKRFDVLPKSD